MRRVDSGVVLLTHLLLHRNSRNTEKPAGAEEVRGGGVKTLWATTASLRLNFNAESFSGVLTQRGVCVIRQVYQVTHQRQSVCECQ